MRRAVATFTCAVLAVACASPAPAAPTTTPLPTAAPPVARNTPAPVVVQALPPQPAPQPAVQPQASVVPEGLPLSLLVGRSGADLRVGLDVLLEEDAFLSTMAMQAESSGRLEEQIGVTGMLDKNAATLAGVVGSFNGQPAAQSFLEAWRAQTSDLLGYAAAHQSAVDTHREAVAASLATGSFSRSDAATVLQQRFQLQEAVADGVNQRDAARTAQQLASLLTASDQLGRPLAAGMAAHSRELSPSNTEGADVDLRLQLDSALVAHLLLTAAAMGAAADGRLDESKAYAGAAGSTAEGIGGQLNQSFGSDVGSGVAERLRAETSAYLAAAQVAERAQAARDLDRLRSEMDGLLSGADQLLAPGLMNAQLRASDQPLLSAADAFAARDFAQAYARVHESVRMAQKPAETLALAIIDRYPARYLVLATPTPSP